MWRSILNYTKRKKYTNSTRYKFYRELGASIGEGCEIYGGVSFGSEPYLIRIGDNVRITSGVKLITHDGGMWVIRNLSKELSGGGNMSKATYSVRLP